MIKVYKSKSDNLLQHGTCNESYIYTVIWLGFYLTFGCFHSLVQETIKISNQIFGANVSHVPI